MEMFTLNVYQLKLKKYSRHHGSHFLNYILTPSEDVKSPPESDKSWINSEIVLALPHPSLLPYNFQAAPPFVAENYIWGPVGICTSKEILLKSSGT